MAKIRFLMDVHVHRAITSGLRRRDIEAATCQELALDRATDESIVEAAAAENRVIFTQDDDFLPICSDPDRNHAGLVYSHKQNPIGRIVAGLTLIHEVLDSSEMENHVEFV